MGKHLYLNKLAESDELETYYMFRHIYSDILKQKGFEITSSGLLGKQIWYLFIKPSKALKYRCNH